ncbi:MAG: endonuclease III [Candidatus Paceibacterota bacterium]
MKTKKNTSIEVKRADLVRRELKKLYPGELQTPLNYSSDIDLLVAVMLSAQSTDKGVNKLTSSLFETYKGVEDYVRVPIKTLETELASINYYHTKARNIQKTMAIIFEKHAGVVPDSMEQLLDLPGVGRKTANVVLGHLFQKVIGIAVDTHVIRLSRKFGLTKSHDALHIEKELMLLIPQKDWWEFSHRIKAYGREVSPARRGNDDPISQKLLKQELLQEVIGGRYY